MVENEHEKILKIIFKLIWLIYIVGVIVYFYFLLSGYFLNNFPIVLITLGIILLILGVLMIIYGLTDK